MKPWLLSVLLICLVGPSVRAEWLTSYPDALAKAAQEDKVILMDFTGSDWCGWCKKLKKEVFDQKEFIEFANENLVLLEVDFPNKPIPRELKEANAKLAAQFGIKGYPTLYFVDKNGTRLGQGGYVAGGPKPFLATVMKVRGYKWKQLAASGNSAAQETAQPAVKPAVVPAPAYVPPPPIRYDTLALKGISGSKNKKLALINNHTLAVGEKNTIKWGDKKIGIECLEIRDDSVLIQVEGEKEPRELKLNSNKILN